MNKRGRIAFITTPEYRKSSEEAAREFIYQNMYTLCNSFNVLSTGRTFDFIYDTTTAVRISSKSKDMIAADMGVPADKNTLATWRNVVSKNISKVQPGIAGMIDLTYELVEGRLDAVIHLTDWDDVVGKPDSMVLRREANVHNVPIASDIGTAKQAVMTWKQKLPKPGPVFSPRLPPKQLPLAGLKSGDSVLALIAHDGMKLEMCAFFVEHAKTIFDQYEFILATGTTGTWLQRFALACGRSQRDADRIRCCLSGPKGGDIQIAAAVVKGICSKVIFLQDPFTSHAHETDIKLFEQAMLLFERAALTPGISLQLATNVESAKAIIGI
jgi:methylglyoxal synthase